MIREKMKVIALLPLAAVFLMNTAAGGETLSRVLKGVQEKYRNIPGLSVSYTREVITKSMSMLGKKAKGDIAEGIIYFKPPCFLRLEQETPKPETIVANKEIIWWYVQEKKLAYRYPAEGFAKELKVLGDIFSGLADVEERFRVSLAEKEEQKNGQKLVLQPDPPWEETDRISIAVSPEYEIREVAIHNQIGSTTRFFLNEQSEKEGFPEGFFEFTPPAGVEVIHEDN